MDIEPEKFAQIKNELLGIFGGFSLHPLHVEGCWTNPQTNSKYFDNSKRIEVSIPKTDENIMFLQDYKEKLKQLFRQEDIYMIYAEIMQV